MRTVAISAFLCLACLSLAADRRQPAASATTNADGTVTYTSAFKSGACTNAQSISLTFEPPAIRKGTNVLTHAQIEERTKALEARMAAIQERARQREAEAARKSK